MNFLQVLALHEELQERERTLLVLLYEIVDRTQQQREGYYSLRMINDYAYAEHQKLKDPSIPPETKLELSVEILKSVCALTQREVDRIDALGAS